MKITNVNAYSLRTRTALVGVFTDAGVDGIGECSPMNVPDIDQLVTDRWEFRDGSMTMPDRPGLGLALNETALDRALLR